MHVVLDKYSIKFVAKKTENITSDTWFIKYLCYFGYNSGLYGSILIQLKYQIISLITAFMDFST